MGRRILAVVAGYATLFVLVFATFSGAYRGLGAERAFQPGTYETTTMWNLLSLALGFVAALWGGFVAAKIGRSAGAVKALAVVVLVVGAAVAIPQLMPQPDPGPRTGDVSNNEAMQKSHPPAWIVLLNPIIGALGTMAGGVRARVF